jgi:hypothetical protein
MQKVRIMIVTVALALFTIIPSMATPAYASHTCALDDVDRTVDTVCENYHNPKPLLSFLLCLVLPTC